jgi:hypothetical protein
MVGMKMDYVFTFEIEMAYLPFPLFRQYASVLSKEYLSFPLHPNWYGACSCIKGEF